jgi:hypothetical protein
VRAGKLGAHVIPVPRLAAIGFLGRTSITWGRPSAYGSNVGMSPPFARILDEFVSISVT